jgi:tripartite-type tricarboxylate transporter receptor subunit TctC
VEEAGVKGFEAVSLGGVVGPAGMPPDISAKLTQTIKEIIESSDMQQKIVALGMLPLASTAKQFEAMMSKEREKYGNLIKATQIKAE